MGALRCYLWVVLAELISLSIVVQLVGTFGEGAWRTPGSDLSQILCRRGEPCCGRQLGIIV